MTKKTLTNTAPTNNPPVAKLRIGLVNANVWQRVTEEGTFYNVSFERRFNKGGQWASTQSYGYDDLLAIAKLANDAHTAISKLRGEEAE